MNKQTPIIVWYRNDLRIKDHEPLYKASLKTNLVIPVYCLDPRQFEETAYGFTKTGYWRAKFLLETLSDLQHAFDRIGSKLVIRIGKPEELLPALAAEIGAKTIYASKEVTDEEIIVEKSLEDNLWKKGKSLKLFWQATLYHLEDLPYPIGSLPDVFTQFRKSVERKIEIRNPFPMPSTLMAHGVNSENLPSLVALGLKPLQQDKRAALSFKGGVTAAEKRLNHYFWDSDSLKDYKETRNGLLGSDYSSKFSPWLANGSLSPRLVYQEIKRYESERVKNKSTYWLYFELLWRDYFRLVAKKYGNAIFRGEGIKGKQLDTSPDLGKFQKWMDGRTGIPFIDANMREIAQTGYMSNRGRQNVASFLVKDLKIDWILGAAYFEHILVDYDPCSNWCNWNYVAGVGNDPRENRYFNILSQAKRYDPKGDYVKHWLPELKSIPNDMVHTAGKGSGRKKAREALDTIDSYPEPLVSYDKWGG